VAFWKGGYQHPSKSIDAPVAVGKTHTSQSTRCVGHPAALAQKPPADIGERHFLFLTESAAQSQQIIAMLLLSGLQHGDGIP
jgi:hypothetical protein